MSAPAAALMAALLSAPAALHAQGSYMHYENHNQVDPRPIRLDAVAGIVRGPGGKPIPHAQVGVFGEDHVQIAALHTDRRGRFAFVNTAPGRYRIIARYEPFCTANIPVFVAPASGGKPTQTLEIHMQLGGIDACSFGVPE